MDAVTLTRAAAFWIVAALGFSILFPGPASAAGDSAAAAQQRPAASPPSSQASEMDAIAEADLIRYELFYQAISVDRLIVDLDSMATTGGKSPTKSGRHRFDLRIIPQADEGRADARSLQ